MAKLSLKKEIHINKLESYLVFTDYFFMNFPFCYLFQVHYVLCIIGMVR